MGANPPYIDPACLREFCLRWGVRTLWLFGSAARGEARLDSDVDILVDFMDDAATSTWDWPAMTDELSRLFGRDVDLLSMGVLRNPHRRESILACREVLYAA